MLLEISRCAEYSCGVNGFQFPGTLPYVVHLIITVIKIFVPILLIIFGMLDLGKAVVASKEDEIKKGQQMFLKRAISAIIVFFVVQIVQILVRFIANDGNNPGLVECFNCFINNSTCTEINTDACSQQG